MPICPKGHESAAEDYCDHCGIKIDGAGAGPDSSPADGATPAAASVVPDKASADADDAPPCPVCGTPKTGRFCEQDGYDFLTASLEGAPGVGAPEGGQAKDRAAESGRAEDGAPAAADASAPGPDAASPHEPAGGGVLMAVADRGHFEKVRAASGPDADGIGFPAYCPERRFRLRGAQLVIGRRSRSRGIEPDIDLVGPPEDPGVSHLHAMLVAQPDGGWAVVDLDSANGTYVNDAPDPIRPNTPVPLSDGDRIHLGAWTKLILQLDG